MRSPYSAIAWAHHSGRLERGGAEVHPAAAGGQGRGERLVVADAAGELHVDVELADHPGEQLAVAAAAEGGVEVDQVHPLGAVALPGHGRLERVAVGGLAAGLPLHQADGLAVGDVDGGEQLQLRHGDQRRDARRVRTPLRQAGRRGVRRRRPPAAHGARLRPRPAGAARGAGAAARARDPGAVGRASARAGRSWCWRRRRTATGSGRRPPTAGPPTAWLTRMRRAPLLIVPMSDKAAYLDRYAEPDKGWTDRDESRWPVPYWDVDAGMAALLMLLTAVDEGLGACFFGVPPERIDRVPGRVRRARGASGRSAACRSATPGTTTVAPRRCAAVGAPSRRSCTVAGGEGRAVLVTGGSRGIGRAIASAFAEQGDRVAVHWGSVAGPRRAGAGRAARRRGTCSCRPTWPTPARWARWSTGRPRSSAASTCW